MAGYRDDREGARADRDPVSLADPLVDNDPGLLGDRVGVGLAGDHRRTGGPDDLGERAVVVPVPVRGDDGGETPVADQLEQTGRVVGGVDQDLVAGVGAAQQVAVVGHRRVDGDLGDLQGTRRTPVRLAAGGDLAGVVVLRRHVFVVRRAWRIRHGSVLHRGVVRWLCTYIYLLESVCRLM